MDLNVGQHCSVASCNVNDLLPIQCSQCKSHFCREHFAIDHHRCNGAAGSFDEQSSAWEKRAICGFAGCGKPTLASAFDASGSGSSSVLNDGLCPQCSEAFCVTHRYSDAHYCKGTTNAASDVPVKASQVEAARALLAKNFPETSKTKEPTSASTKPMSASVSKSKQPKDPTKLAKFKAVELIKMRHKASPGNPKDENFSVALDRRVHLFVVNEAGAEGGRPMLLWFRKDMICGRVLDLLDVRFALTKTPTRLVIIGDDDSERDARLDQAIGEQAFNGNEIVVRVRT